MGKINWTRVILGGLAAGLIINVFESLLNGAILAKDMEAAIRALGRQMGGGALAMFIAWGFLVGIFAAWLYAAIRRSGASGISWLQSPRSRCIFSRDISWPLAWRWD